MYKEDEVLYLTREDIEQMEVELHDYDTVVICIGYNRTAYALDEIKGSVGKMYVDYRGVTYPITFTLGKSKERSRWLVVLRFGDFRARARVKVLLNGVPEDSYEMY